MAKKKAEELSLIQSRAIALMVAGYSNRDVAIKLNLSQETISIWHRQSFFIDSKKKALNTIFEAAMAEMIDGTIEAVRELRAIIQDPEAPQKTKISAISILLNTITNSKNRENKHTPLLDVSDAEGDKKLEAGIEFLISTATTRDELKEAILLMQKQTVINHQLSEKMTADKYASGLNEVRKIMSKYIPEEYLEEFQADIEQQLKG